MRSSLTWVDHDSAARERSLQIIGMFSERESRDELGLGAIRDSFSDKLFPGTSTIQTRLRYMLIIPWVFQTLEERRIPSNEIEARARRSELQLIEPLLDSGDSKGCIGEEARWNLKQLPSAVYWVGLGEWGLRRFDGSISEYFWRLDQIYEDRRQRRNADEDDAMRSSDVVTWDPQLPGPPKDFPENLSFSLTREEAEFLRDTIVRAAGDSLLGWLVRENKLTGDIERPWEHPDQARFPASIKNLLQHARLFSEVMRGAAILYNLLLAEKDGREELKDERQLNMEEWADMLEPEINAVRNWSQSLPDLWEAVAHSGYAITPATRSFVKHWARYVGDGPHKVIENKEARSLVERRERSLKKNRSRFVNARAREQWSGCAGMRPMTFRWPRVKQLLKDLDQGLQQD